MKSNLMPGLCPNPCIFYALQCGTLISITSVIVTYQVMLVSTAEHLHTLIVTLWTATVVGAWHPVLQRTLFTPQVQRTLLSSWVSTQDHVPGHHGQDAQRGFDQLWTLWVQIWGFHWTNIFWSGCLLDGSLGFNPVKGCWLRLFCIKYDIKASKNS